VVAFSPGAGDYAIRVCLKNMRKCKNEGSLALTKAGGSRPQCRSPAQRSAAAGVPRVSARAPHAAVRASGGSSSSRRRRSRDGGGRRYLDGRVEK